MARLRQEQLNRILELGDAGMLTAEAVVEDAANEDSPLHDLFTWNDQTAAEQWRLEEARALIRTVEYQITRNNIVLSAPRYVPDPDAPRIGGGYATIGELAQDPERSARAVVAEITRALGFVRRAEAIARMLAVGGDVTQAVQLLTLIKAQLEAGPDQARGAA